MNNHKKANMKRYMWFIVKALISADHFVSGTSTSGSTTVTKNDGKYVGQTALYWGQASAQEQERLRYYCDTDSVDIFLLSFLAEFPNSKSSKHGCGLNLANACTKEGDSPLNCSEVGDDIKYCQSLGKKILLSLGGETGEYGFKNDEEAGNFAKTLWNSFGDGSDVDNYERPFGDARVDGFDFDIENEKQTGYTALAKRLRQLSSSSDKDYKLTAAPQCPFPDMSTSDLIDEFDLDYIFIQFYNNDCSLDQDFNFDTWANYIESKSKDTKTKLFVGLPATKESAGTGFVEYELILEKIDQIWSNKITRDLFGGFMFWDASQAFGFSSDVNINKIKGNLVTNVAIALQGRYDPKASENTVPDNEDGPEETGEVNDSTIDSSSVGTTRTSSTKSSSTTFFSTAYPSAVPKANGANSRWHLF